MKTIDLIPKSHTVKIGDTCSEIEPNIKEDSLLVSDGEVIGFYLKQIPDKLKQYIEIANAELLSDRVPKSYMDRKRPIGTNENGTIKYEVIKQFSTIIGSCAPKPHMRRPYPMVSSVHNVKSTETFIKAMLLACKESEEVIRQIAPTVYEKQEKIITEKVPPKWRFGRLFTSSISNYNIAANYHRDAANLEGCVNVIIAKRSHAKGGNTTIPDYSATVDSADNSMLVYPAWRNVHGVTPIIPLREDGYRNSLVFYPLKAFNAYW
jgi:hypothetical protein